jgi:hypothetical protein
MRFEIFGHSVGFRVSENGTMVQATALVRMSRLDDNLPARLVTVSVKAAPETDKGELEILSADVEEQLVEILRLIGALGPEGEGFF